MTTNELMVAVLKLCPNATIGADTEGQVIVFTDMRLSIDPNGIEQLTEMEG